MRIGAVTTRTGLSGVALIAMIVVSGCSGGTTTVYEHSPAGTNPDGTPSNTTMTADPTKPDPSMQGDPTNKDTPAPPLVAGLAITDVAVFQGVKVPVVTAGKALSKSERNAPVVVGRPALFRAYVKPAADYKGGSVTAELRLVSGTTRLPVVQDTKSITVTSTDADISSTFNFEVPADSLPADVTYQVLLTSKDGTVPTGASDARFPTTGGVQALENEKSGTVKVVIVPVKYDYDGSGRVPDTSPAMLDAYKQSFMARYPATDITITARAPWSWTQRISANGTGFDTVLNGVTNLRKTDQVAADVYYYGALAPTQSFGSFCGGGCVTGLSTVVDSAQTSFLRASVGVGFTGVESTDTAVHEVGHAHGRNHAPCGGAQGVDPSFPYSGGSIGVWGYDILAKTFLSPSKGTDMMGYCDNTWVSDYTYSALFDRIAALNGAQATASKGSSSGASTMPQTFKMASVGADGSVAWTNDIDLDEAEAPTAGPAGQSREVTYLGAAGEMLGTHTAHFYPYDHLPGGVLVVPSAPQASSSIASKARALPTWTKVRISGAPNTLSR